MQQTPKALEDCHQLLGWVLPRLDQFPRNRRFTLGERIESGLLFVLECLVEATYTSKPAAVLKAANLRLEVVRHLWRLAFECKALAMKSWQYGVGLMLELGKQLGGWMKSSRT